MATKRRHRAIAAFFAGLFLLTSSALTITVIYTMLDEKNKNKANEQQAEEVNMEDKLQGKPLANFTPIEDIKELKTEDIKEGNGTKVEAGNTVTVDYTGALANTGIVFESSKDAGQPATLSLSQVIAGWSQGIPGMKEGGTRRLLIPSELAYGSQGAGSIPANSDLVFDVTVYKVDK